MRLKFFLPAVLFSLSAYAQDQVWVQPSGASDEYHVYRTEMAWPSYGLSKIMDLIEKIKFDTETRQEALDKKTYDELSLREKFTYHMIHAESFGSPQDAKPPILDEHKKIFGYLPDIFDESTWSSRQTNFLKDNRDTVIALIKISCLKSGRVEANYKHAIAGINGTEMIPFLVSMYNRSKKDHDILTLLMLLMEHNNYPPFKTSLSHRKLYSEESDYQSYLDFNKANEALIIKRAMDFYNGLKN